MLRVLDCITLYHDPALTVLAGLICLLGCLSSAAVAGRVDASQRPLPWSLLLSLCFSATAWSTHFVAMLAFRLGVPTTYAPGPTLLSLFVGVSTVSVGIAIAVQRRERWTWRACGGALTGAGVIALHYIGMSALRFPGTLDFAPDLVVASLVAGIGFGSLALVVMFGRDSHWARPLGASLLLITTLSLHFLGMGAVELSLGPDDGTSQEGLSRNLLAAAVALVSLVVIGIGATSALLDRRLAGQLAHLARHDALTGLPNRRYFGELAEQMRASAGTYAVYAIDLDDFKSINDVHGHAAGDAVIRTVGQRIADTVGTHDVVARIGGDEFVLVSRLVDGQETALALAGRIHAALSAGIPYASLELQAGASIGTALYPVDGRDLDTLIRHADVAMYHAKRHGKGASALFEPAMRATLDARRHLEARLRLALDEGAMDLHYQPLVTGDDRRLLGFEALLRWHDAELGPVSPDRFVPVAESTGLIVPIGRFVLERACREAMKWPDSLTVSVNLSAVQVSEGSLVDTVRGALEQSGLSGERLELEITESLLLENRERTLQTLDSLRAMGIRIAMDDFGTGFSSIGYLRDFAFDKIKIDRSFVSGSSIDDHDRDILRAAIALGRSLGLRVTAEGVETDEQAKLLADLDCDELQGYLIARPMPPEAVADYLASIATIAEVADPDARGSGPHPAGDQPAEGHRRVA